MKRDMEIIRALLLWHEQDGAGDSQPEALRQLPDPILLEHLHLLIEAGLVEGEVMWGHESGRRRPVAVSVDRITWEGHEFISLLGRDEHWERVKSKLLETGASWSLATILEYLKSQAGRLWLGGS